MMPERQREDLLVSTNLKRTETIQVLGKVLDWAGLGAEEGVRTRMASLRFPQYLGI